MILVLLFFNLQSYEKKNKNASVFVFLLQEIDFFARLLAFFSYLCKFKSGRNPKNTPCGSYGL